MMDKVPQKRDLFYEDITEGMVLITATRTVSEADVMLFAGLTGDFNELHTSRTYAENTSFGERIAHGMLTLSIANGLYMRMGYFGQSTIANLGIENWRFRKAVFLGDTLHVRIILNDKHVTSDGKRGVVRWNVEVCNQNEDIVASGIWAKMIALGQHR